MIKSPLPDPRHDPEHLQLPIEAVKIFLDRAVEVMYNNDGITNPDRVWFLHSVIKMRKIADELTKDCATEDYIAARDNYDVPSV